jgi:phage tail-like protein
MRPFTTFNFKIKLWVGSSATELCECEFSECDGLEMNIEPKTIREGGNNGVQIHLMGPMTYGTLTLKRGMTGDFGLWRWFQQVQQDRSLRANGEIQMLSSDRNDVDVRFTLTNCLPIKLRAPGLRAKDGEVAIEEMQIAYETLDLPAATEGV